MIRVHFVGDGPRDAATVPRLVETILNARINDSFKPWARLHTKSGYDRKLRYAIRQARVEDADALVATIDQDRDHSDQRLKKLRRGRKLDRQDAPPFPTAIGRAIPHAEAWLLDDPVAVREAPKLPRDHQIPTVGKTSNPKRELERLRGESPRADEHPTPVLADIASQLQPRRCKSAQRTGFNSFVKDVKNELRPLLA